MIYRIWIIFHTHLLYLNNHNNNNNNILPGCLKYRYDNNVGI